MKPIAKSVQVNFCLINFLFKMTWIKETPHRHCFSILL